MTTRKKKKKQPNTSHQQDERTRMNVFYQTMHSILTDYHCEEVIGLMDKHLKIAFYRMRTPPCRIFRLNCPEINDSQFNTMEDLLKWTFHRFFVPLKAGGKEISLHQFCSIGFNLILLIAATQEEDNENYKRIHELLTTHLNLQEASEKANQMTDHICRFASAYFSSYANYAVTINPEIPNELKNRCALGLQLHISTHKVPVHYFNVNRHLRPAFRIGLPKPDRQIHWVSINRALFDHTPFDDHEMAPIYIQSHVFQRLAERLDLINKEDFYYHILVSIRNGTIIRYKRYHLIEFLVMDCKLGYLVADLVEGKLLLKTFLFLPSDGTPEGEKLEQLCGLTKVDMKYLKIDHLSAFYHSDIKDVPRLKKLFIDAGCASLFKFCEQEKNKTCRHDQLASYILQYIQLDQDKELPAIAG